MSKFIPATPLDYRSKSFALKLDEVTKGFLYKCTNVEMYVPRKRKPYGTRLCNEYGAIKYTLSKCDEYLINCLYDYLYQLEPKVEIMDLKQLFINAEKYRIEQQWKTAEGQMVKPKEQKSLLDELMGME